MSDITVMKRVTDCEAVMRHLMTGKSLTQDEAKDLYGIRRLSARIFDLREEFGEGQIITITKRSQGDKYAEYHWNFNHSKHQLNLFQ